MTDFSLEGMYNEDTLLPFCFFFFFFLFFFLLYAHFFVMSRKLQKIGYINPSMSMAQNEIWFKWTA